MKTRLKGAQKGHSLLKKKSDALTGRFRAILKQIVEVDLRCPSHGILNNLMHRRKCDCLFSTDRLHKFNFIVCYYLRQQGGGYVIILSVIL